MSAEWLRPVRRKPTNFRYPTLQKAALDFGEFYFNNVSWRPALNKNDQPLVFGYAFALCRHRFDGNIIQFVAFFHRGENTIKLGFRCE
jgi:hypothetical protein